MKPIDWAIRQHIFETLLTEGQCTNLQIGSDYSDGSYADFSEAIRFEYKGQLVHIMVKDWTITSIANNGPMSFAWLTDREIDPARPCFADADEALREIFVKVSDYVSERGMVPWYSD